MAVRTSMAAIISRVRELIGDAAGADQVFTDQQIQDTLDTRRRRTDAQYLSPVSSVAAGGGVSYLTYIAPTGYWEDDVLLQDGSYEFLAASVDTADLLTGQWVFTATQAPPVMITGKTYDIYAAAADVLEMWLAKIKLDYDFLSSGRTFKRSQQIEGLSGLIRTYRGRSWVTTSHMIRTDMNVINGY
jgi:hypothetical protein